MSKKRIAVLFGGVSSEHEVSLVSATSVITHLSKEIYEIIPVGITKRGDWFFYQGPIENISCGKWEKDSTNIRVTLSVCHSHHGLLLLNDTVDVLPIDCVFPVLHGQNGEDGKMQGLMEIAGIPYVGCNTLSSAVCMDKVMTHTLLEEAGIPMAPWMSITKQEFDASQEFYNNVEKTLGFPVFVKPANSGSSVGITKATGPETLKKSIHIAFEHDNKVLVEQAIRGKEVECAVLGNQNPKASALGEIVPCNEFYDYEAKYQSSSKLIIPAQMDAHVTKTLQDRAVLAFSTLECNGLSRVDFFVTDQHEVILNEINTLPGFTSISMYPKLWDHSGIAYPELLTALIDLAMAPSA